MTREEDLLAQILEVLRGHKTESGRNLADLAQLFRSSGQRRKANISKVYTLDTSTTVEQKLDFVRDLGVPAMNVTLVSAGGGVNIRFGREDYYAPPTGTSIADEEITFGYWYGVGAVGTAILRVSGRLEDA